MRRWPGVRGEVGVVHERDVRLVVRAGGEVQLCEEWFSKVAVVSNWGWDVQIERSANTPSLPPADSPTSSGA